jgi:acylphosphatase
MTATEDVATRGRNGQNRVMTTKTVRKRVVVHGRVQGVWFRASAREHALARGVAGWIRNRPDGAVEAVLEGEPDAVQQVVRFLQTGPPGARVERIEVSDEQPEGLTGFHVR